MDRFDPRWADDRNSDRSADRDWGGRSGRDAEHAPDHEARGPFARHLDLPHGDARERVQSRRRDYDLDGAEQSLAGPLRSTCARCTPRSTASLCTHGPRTVAKGCSESSPNVGSSVPAASQRLTSIMRPSTLVWEDPTASSFSSG